VRGAVVVALALLLSGCAMTGRTFGTYVDDAAVTGRVKMSLASLHLSHLRRVNVDVYGGTVYLTGTVQTPVEKSDAEIAAWKVKDVEQVVNDLVVEGGDAAPAALALPTFERHHPLMERFARVERVETAAQGAPALAYDGTGRVVATIYTLGSRALVDAGVMTLPANGRPIDHVSIYPIPGRTDLPETQYAVVLWHVSEQAAARR
jgi:hyperosmotically inducible periplasmic protein